MEDFLLQFDEPYIPHTARLHNELSDTVYVSRVAQESRHVHTHVHVALLSISPSSSGLSSLFAPFPFDDPRVLRGTNYEGGWMSGGRLESARRKISLNNATQVANSSGRLGHILGQIHVVNCEVTVTNL